MTKSTNQDILERLVRLEDTVTNMDKALRSELGSFGAIVMDLNKDKIERGAIEKYKSTIAMRATNSTVVWKDPKVIQIILYLALALLLLVGAALRFDVSRLL